MNLFTIIKQKLNNNLFQVKLITSDVIKIQYKPINKRNKLYI